MGLGKECLSCLDSLREAVESHRMNQREVDVDEGASVWLCESCALRALFIGPIENLHVSALLHVLVVIGVGRSKLLSTMRAHIILMAPIGQSDPLPSIDSWINMAAPTISCQV